jgi:hypothetical protein
LGDWFGASENDTASVDGGVVGDGVEFGDSVCIEFIEQLLQKDVDGNLYCRPTTTNHSQSVGKEFVGNEGRAVLALGR